MWKEPPEPLLEKNDEAGINAWREQVDFLGRGDGMIEHIWCEYGIDKRRFSV